MEIARLSLAEGAEAARGIAVVIDVFRAFTCEPLLYACGARRIVLEGDIGRCLAWKDRAVPRAVLIGEHNELPIDGFDLTNSPYLILRNGKAMFAGRTVVHRTTSGVTGALPRSPSPSASISPPTSPPGPPPPSSARRSRRS